MKLKTKLSKLRHDGHITDAEYAVIINVLNKFSTQPPKTPTCEDAVSRAALLEELGEEPFNWNDSPEAIQEVRDYQWFRSLVENAQPVTPKKTKWIPVSERLPDEGGRYLVTRGLKACGSLWNRVYIVNYSDLMGLKSERIWWDGNVGKSDFKRIDDVIAWMPLPRPYEVEKWFRSLVENAPSLPQSYTESEVKE